MYKIVDYHEKYLPELLGMCMDLTLYDQQFENTDYKENVVDLFASFWDWIETIEKSNDFKILMALNNDEPIGFVIGEVNKGLPFRKFYNQSVIMHMFFVKPKFRRTQVASLLYDEFELQMELLGHKTIYTAITIGNETALHATRVVKGYNIKAHLLQKEL